MHVSNQLKTKINDVGLTNYHELSNSVLNKNLGNLRVLSNNQT